MRRLVSLVGAVAVISLVACGPSKRNNGDDDPVDAREPDTYCPTSISGKVFAPNGTLPLSGVTVYAPISDAPPFEPGVQCGQCTTSLPGGAFATTTTDAEGKFKLEGMPIGNNIPVIVTTGKWRRKFVVPATTACADTPIADGEYRLPRNRIEGEMPRIAVVAGTCDNLENVFRNLGIDAAEFGLSSAGSTAIVRYNTTNAAPPNTLWGDLNELKKFDLVVNSCECSENNGNKTNPDLLRQYADLGGRILGSHYHYTWMKNLIPQWSGTATYFGDAPAPPAGASTGPDLVDMTHPGGQTFAKWLVAVGGSSTLGQIALTGDKRQHMQGAGTGATRWLMATGSGGVQPLTHYLSFNTPVGMMPENQCGKVVYTSMHVTPGNGSTFSADEKAFAYLIFDLTTCINPLE